MTLPVHTRTTRRIAAVAALAMTAWPANAQAIDGLRILSTPVNPQQSKIAAADKMEARAASVERVISLQRSKARSDRGVAKRLAANIQRARQLRQRARALRAAGKSTATSDVLVTVVQTQDMASMIQMRSCQGSCAGCACGAATGPFAATPKAVRDL